MLRTPRRQPGDQYERHHRGCGQACRPSRYRTCVPMATVVEFLRNCERSTRLGRSGLTSPGSTSRRPAGCRRPGQPGSVSRSRCPACCLPQCRRKRARSWARLVHADHGGRRVGRSGSPVRAHAPAQAAQPPTSRPPCSVASTPSWPLTSESRRSRRDRQRHLACEDLRKCSARAGMVQPSALY